MTVLLERTETTAARRSGTIRWSKLLGRIFVYSCLAILALVFVAPLLSMIFTSLKSMDEIRSGNLLSFPSAPSLDAWASVWDASCIGVTCGGLRGYFVNSFLIVIPATLISVALGALNGYVFAQWRFRGDNVLFGLILFGCFIPFQIVLIPMAGVLGKLGLAGTIPGLVLVHVVYGICFTTMFFRNYFVTVPGEIFKAARVDGAGFLGGLLPNPAADFLAHRDGVGHLAVHRGLERLSLRGLVRGRE